MRGGRRIGSLPFRARCLPTCGDVAIVPSASGGRALEQRPSRLASSVAALVRPRWPVGNGRTLVRGGTERDREELSQPKKTEALTKEKAPTSRRRTVS